MSDELKVINLTRKSDGKVITLSELLEVCRDTPNKIEDSQIYGYRQSEAQEKPTAWVYGKELKLWIKDKPGEETIVKYMHIEGEKMWRRQILDSIEPGMTKERADELKIEQRINLMDETYSITVDGKVVGEPYPMPPGMLDQLIWGPVKPNKTK